MRQQGAFVHMSYVERTRSLTCCIVCICVIAISLNTATAPLRACFPFCGFSFSCSIREQLVNDLRTRLDSQAERDREPAPTSTSTSTSADTDIHDRVRALQHSVVRKDGHIKELRARIEVLTQECDAYKEQVRRAHVMYDDSW